MRDSKKNSKPYKHDIISSEIERIVSEVVAYEIQDKRVFGLAEVTGIILSRDFSHCKVFVKISSDDKKEVLAGLINANGFVRHVIAEQLDMRKTPEIAFYNDESIEKAKRIEELLAQIK